MSSNRDEAGKTPKVMRALVPALRFPEFRDAGEWCYIPLHKLAKRCLQKNHKDEMKRVLTNSAEYGVVDQRDFFDKDIANQSNLWNYFIVEKGDYVYNPRISTSAPVGPISKNNIATGVMSPLYTVFRFNSSDNDFFAYFFKSNGWHHYMRQISNSGARHDRMAITNDDFMAMPLPVTSTEEQQKIADCLSSVDELITLQARKIDALKSHKKGLMQQLFPAEGETLPKLRFPEFRDAGEWEEKKLGELCEMRAGKFVSAGEISEKNEDALYPCYGGNGLRGYVKTYTHSGKYPLIGRQGALCGNVILGEGKFHATEHAVAAAPFSCININWLFYSLLKLDLNRFATGQAQPGLSVDVLEKVDCLVQSIHDNI